MGIIIETKRLLLRELVATDEQGIYELDSDPEVHRYLGNNPIKDIKQARQVITFIQQQYVTNGIGRLAIIEKETNSFVGWGGFKLITEPTNGHQGYHDLGYRLIRRYWGKGYATESSLAVVEYGFNQLNLPVIHAMANLENLSSRKVLEKTGFKNIETFDYDSIPHCWFKIINPEHLGE
ncbi:GNAT family N-acetyltransferase [Arcticibacter eurypsychrophilus]|uniref:GNAT family N-acetyltransferase n=1 Tax=Arcticibacter eurypsychrophilus TaxID=1434752 RepID=UPI00084D5016|nr:GNAT family N-acetyltransferase [Arcticibacter eurypsychrophilus]